MHQNILSYSSFLKPKFIHTFFALSLASYYVATHPPLMFRLASHIPLPHLIQQVISENLQTVPNYKPPLKLGSHSLSVGQSFEIPFVEKTLIEKSMSYHPLINKVLKKNSNLPLNTIQATAVKLFVFQSGEKPVAPTTVPFYFMTTHEPVVPIEPLVAHQETIVNPRVLEEVIVAPEPVIPIQQALNLPQIVESPVVEVIAIPEPIVPVQQAVIATQVLKAKIVDVPEPALENKPFQNNLNEPPQKPLLVISASPSRIEHIHVKEGDRVEKGQPLLKTSFMKMEDIIRAKVDGVIGRILIKQGDNVAVNQRLAEIKPAVELPVLKKWNEYKFDSKNQLLKLWLMKLAPGRTFSQDETMIRIGLIETLLSPAYQGLITMEWEDSDEDVMRTKRGEFCRAYLNHIKWSATSYEKLFLTPEKDWHAVNEKAYFKAYNLPKKLGISAYRDDDFHV